MNVDIGDKDNLCHVAMAALGLGSLLGLTRPRRKAAAAMTDEGGLDSEGKSYDSRDQMWRDEAGVGTVDGSSKRQEWYQKGISYWQGIDATVDGVLGGYGNVDSRDIVDSSTFITEILKDRIPDAVQSKKKLVALDCGAGVGRVTQNLLLRHFHEVDLVEPVKHFLDAAKASLTSEPPLRNGHKAVNFYCTPLQEFTPEAGRYDVIWVQWCIGHLTDEDFLAFFQRAQVGLKPGGFYVLKENIARHGFVVDKLDSSVTRSDAYFRDLFQRAGLHLHKSKLQKGFPRELFSVRMYALYGVDEDDDDDEATAAAAAASTTTATATCNSSKAKALKKERLRQSQAKNSSKPTPTKKPNRPKIII